MINDGLAAEQQGLHGKAYFDARYPRSERKDLKSYAFYDQSIHRAAEYLQSLNKMPVIINDERRLFAEGEAPEAALYCGWYSLARYVDAFDWVPGAVGYHIASQGAKPCRAAVDTGVKACWKTALRPPSAPSRSLTCRLSRYLNCSSDF